MTEGNPPGMSHASALLHPRYWPTWIALGVLRIMEPLPFGFLVWLGNRIGGLVGRLPLRFVRIARRNLELCLPEQSVEERERHGYDSLPLYVREGAVIPMSERTDRPDHPYLDDLELVVFPGADASGVVVPVVREVRVTDPDGRTGVFTVELDAAGARARGSRADGWSLRSFGGGSSAAQGGTARLAW